MLVSLDYSHHLLRAHLFKCVRSLHLANDQRIVAVADVGNEGVIALVVQCISTGYPILMHLLRSDMGNIRCVHPSPLHAFQLA